MRQSLFRSVMLCSIFFMGCQSDVDTQDDSTNDSANVVSGGELKVGYQVSPISAVMSRGYLSETIDYYYDVLRYNYLFDESSTITLAVQNGEGGSLVEFSDGVASQAYSTAEVGDFLTSQLAVAQSDVEIAAGSKITAFVANDNSAVQLQGQALQLSAEMVSSFANSGEEPLMGDDFAQHLYMRAVMEIDEGCALDSLISKNLEFEAISKLFAVRMTNNTTAGKSCTLTKAKITASQPIFPAWIVVDDDQAELPTSEADYFSELIATTDMEGISIAPGGYATLYMLALPNAQSGLGVEDQVIVSATIGGVEQSLLTFDGESFASMLGDQMAYVFDLDSSSTSSIELSVEDSYIAESLLSTTSFSFEINAVNRQWEILVPDWITVVPSWGDAHYSPVAITMKASSASDEAANSGNVEFVDMESGEVMHTIAVTQSASKVATYLLALLEDLNDGAAQPVELNWSATTPVEQWEGVTLDDSGEVIGIDLSGRGFEGVLPSTNIAKFTSLVTLDLSHNSLTGSLLINYGTPKALEYVDLSHNKISFVNLQAFITSETATRSIKYLYLNDNEITSTIGGVNEVVNMPNLVEINLSNNNFGQSITVKTGVAGPESLRLYDVSNGGFAGTLPEFINSSPNLEVLKTNDNSSLNGTIGADLVTQLKEAGYTDQDIYDKIISNTSISVSSDADYLAP